MEKEFLKEINKTRNNEYNFFKQKLHKHIWKYGEKVKQVMYNNYKYLHVYTNKTQNSIIRSGFHLTELMKIK